MHGVERFKEIFEKYKDRPILLYGDPDVDGLFSLLLLCQWADMLGLKYSYYVNRNRYHGFELNPDSLKGWMVISADFQITQEEVEALVENDIVLLSTDHHDCQKKFIDVKGTTAEGIVINNQYPFEPEENQYLSGAGVWYELACELNPEFKSAEREAIVGITLLSDVRPIENAKARKYLKTAYSIDPTQGYIHYLITSTLKSDFGFGVPRMDRNFIDFTLSPCINSLLRFDKTDEAVVFILGGGLINFDSKGKQQDLMLDMEVKAQTCVMDKLAILAINSLDFMDVNVPITNFIGLLCSQFKDKHGGISTIGFVFENGKVLRTSFRGRYDDIHYNSAFRNMGLDAHGHPTSFGIQNFKPTDETWVQLNDLVRDLEESHEETIKIINSSNLGMTLTQNGMKLATENCYVRDMYRSYIRYTGKNAKIVRQTFKSELLQFSDIQAGVVPDYTSKGFSYRYVRDSSGNPIPKYIEYSIDGRTVKSFGITIEDGLILPMLEKGYIQLYVRSQLS